MNELNLRRIWQKSLGSFYHHQSFSCILLDFAIRLLDLLAAAHESKPLGDQGIFIQRETSKLVLSDPRFEMIVDCSHSARQDACST